MIAARIRNALTLLLTLLLLMGMFSTLVFAACTYSEAIMAFKAGNQLRGQALMHMAARDGDARAVEFLANASGNLASVSDLADLADNTKNRKLVVMDVSRPAAALEENSHLID